MTPVSGSTATTTAWARRSPSASQMEREAHRAEQAARREARARAESENLAERMFVLLSRSMGTRARWGLEQALNAAEREGVSGKLVISIPAGRAEPVSAEFKDSTSGDQWEIIYRRESASS